MCTWKLDNAIVIVHIDINIDGVPSPSDQVSHRHANLSGNARNIEPTCLQNLSARSFQMT